MKGLLLKEMYFAKNSCRWIIVMIALFLLCSIFGDHNYYFMYYAVILSGMLSFTSMAGDELEGWDKYSLILPISRKTYVSSKYLFTLISELIVLLLVCVVLLIRQESTILPMLMLIFSVSLIVPALSLPLAFRFGTQKGRYALVILMAIVGGVSSILFISDDAAIIRYSEYLSYATVSVLYFAVPLTAALYAISWLISIRVYEKKEL